MKILIISTVRCGGRTFMESLSVHYNLKAIHEPKWKGVDYIFSDNVCVKHVCNRNELDDLFKLSKQFDKVYLLDRSNFKEQLQSLYFLSEITKDMNSNWMWDETLIDELKMNHWRTHLKFVKKLLNDFSNLSNISILYYEDLYFGNVKIEGISPNIYKKLRLSDDKSII